MLLGLQMMDESAKRAFAEELKIDFNNGADLAQLLQQWMGSAVGVSSAEPKEIERAVLHWFATQLKLSDFESLPTDQLEAVVRRKVAEDSHDFLFPFMEVGSAVAYIGPKRVVGPKLEFLESSTAGLIPSLSARERMRHYWQARGAKLLGLQETIEVPDLMIHLEEPLSILRLGSESTRESVIALSHVVALSDGRFEVSEEQFTTLLAQELNVTPERVQQITEEVGQSFWKHLSDLGGATHDQRSTSEQLALTLRAAQLALESSGSLDSFSEVVERGFVGSLHSTLSTGPSWQSRMKEWGRTPLRIPLGFATGMLCYIRDRFRSGDQETLMRLALAAIYRQHLSVTGEHSEISQSDIQDYVKDREVENPADILAETMVGKPKAETVRKITLEPTKFE